MKHVVVGRDRAHVRALLKDFPKSEVISARAFFDRVRVLAFLKNSKLKKDDFAPMMLATKLLAKDKIFSLAAAKSFSTLYSSCFHGTKTPNQIWQELKTHEIECAFVFEMLASIQKVMENEFLTTSVSALYSAWQVIREQGLLPPSFKKSAHITLCHLVDLTRLEIEVIKDLSRLGLYFEISFPLDFQNRGINAAVDFCAQAFESAPDLVNIELSFDNIASVGPLSPLVLGLFKDNTEISLKSENCSVNNPCGVVEEADLIASKVAALLMDSANSSIAVAVRSFDGRSKIYKHALSSFGIPVKDRKGIPMHETQSGILLKTLLSTKLSLSKKNLLSLINQSMFKFNVSDINKRSALMQIMHHVLVVDGLALPNKNRDTLRNLTSRTKLTEGERLAVEDTLTFLENVENLLLVLQETASFRLHLESALTLVDRAFLDHDGSTSYLIEILRMLYASSALIEDAPGITLSEFTTLLMSELSRITMPRADIEEQTAVEFLLLPELLGRKFDHVFIADISFGRLPQNRAPDPLIDDRARITLNLIFKQPIFRVFLDDPFEPLPVPPRQALEPFWFASAIAAAQHSIHFFCASHDEQGMEQAPSEFFLWLSDNVKITDHHGQRNTNPIKPSRAKFLEGVQEKYCPPREVNRVHQIVNERRLALSEQRASKMAFSIPSELWLQRFPNSNAQFFSKVLTPTMVEAFAECRFKGFSQRILAIEENALDEEDVDARVVGEIAHRTLELYVQDLRNRVVSNIDRLHLSKILTAVFSEYVADKFMINTDLLFCHIEWLKDALLSLLHRLFDQNESYRNFALELSFGLKNSEWPAVLIKTNGRSYLLGGRIDRVDQAQDYFLIIDYKLATTSSLRVSLSPKNILSRHFQMPIYARLIAEHLANKDSSKISFAFASIRDGQLFHFDFNNNPMGRRIVDDMSEDGLGRAIDRVIAPLLEGNILATSGDHCVPCKLRYFCRKNDGSRHV